MVPDLANLALDIPLLEVLRIECSGLIDARATLLGADWWRIIYFRLYELAVN